jgi:hypothetical protein
MKTKVTLLGCLLLTSCAHMGGDAFVLKDCKTGKEMGPYWFREGNVISFGQESATIQKVLRTNEVLTEKLKSRIIPEMDFRDADIRDIIAFFQEPRVIQSDAEEIADPPIEIVLVLPAGKEPAEMGIPKVTWHARSLSVFSSLRTLAQMTGMDFAVRDQHVWLIKMK